MTPDERRAKWKKQQRRYYQNSSNDSGLGGRLGSTSNAAAFASDVALRTSLAATPMTGITCGYGDRWGGYTGDGWCDWYCNDYYPGWCGSGGWWNPCGGWGWGWGWGWTWGWSCSWWWGACNWWGPSYSYWPSYAYSSPTVIYETVEVPVYIEGEEQVVVDEGGSIQGPPAPDTSSLAHRAAAEYMALGDRAFIEGRYGDAAHYYAKAIEYSPEDGVLYLVLSDALFATGDYHYAGSSIRKALELSPELAALDLDKHAFYGDPADFDRQLELLELYLTDHFLDEDARLVLATNYLFGGQPEKCVEFLDSPFSEKIREDLTGQLLLAAAVGRLASAAGTTKNAKSVSSGN
jgi:hypothetical protein